MTRSIPVLAIRAVAAVLLAPLAVGVALAAPAAGAAATAEPNKARDEALELFNQGKVAFKAGDFTAALDLFRRAQAKFDREPLIILALAKTLDKAQEFDKALGYFKLFLQVATSSPKTQADRDATQKRIGEIEELLAKRPAVLHFKNLPPGAKVEVDGKSVEVTASSKLEVSPGKHAVRVTLDKRQPFERPTLSLSAGETAEIDVVLLAPLDTAALPHDHKWTLVAGGATVAALVGGAVFGVMALQSQDDYYQIFDSNGHIRAEAAGAYVQKDASGATLKGSDGEPVKCARGIAASACPDAIAEGKRLLDQFSNRRTAMWISFGAGAALAAGTVVAYLKAPVQEPKSKATTSWQLVPSWDGQQAGAVLSATW